MRPSGHPPAHLGEGGLGGFDGGLFPEPYDSFMRSHLRYYGYFQGQKMGGQKTPAALGGPSEQHPDPGCLWGPGQELNRVHRNPSAAPPDLPGGLEPAPHQRTSAPSARHRGSPGEPRGLFALPLVRGPPPAPRWPIECEVIRETMEHIEWVPPEPEPFCQPAGPEQAPAPLGEELGTVVYHLCPGSRERAAPLGAPLASPDPHHCPSGLPPAAPRGFCFTRARVGGAPGPLSSPAAALEGPQDTTLLFESRFESGNLQKAVKVGPYEYVLTLRPDLYTAKHTQWFYFRVQNTRREPLYRFTIANLAKPKSLYGEGMRPLLYSQQDAQSRGIGWRRIGTDIRYYQGGGGGEEPAAFCLSWTTRFPHDGDTCFFAHSYPYTYSDLQRYLRALAGDPVRSQYCAVRALCRSLAGNTVYLLTITSPAGAAAAKRVVVLSARVHPGESGGSWAMRGFLDFLLSAHPDARLLRRLFVFKVVPMLNPDGVVVGNSRCSLAGRDPNRAYGTALRGSFPGVWHLRAMVERVLAEREVVLYCDFHGHSRKNNVFMYGCDGGGAGLRLHQRVFPLMLSKNAPDKFSFPSCKFKVQKSKAGTGRVVMWRMGVSNSYTLEAAFGGSTLGEALPLAGDAGVGGAGGRAVPALGCCRLFCCPLSPPGGRNSHFTVEDLKALGYHLCDTLLDFCDPDPAKFQQCLVEVDVLLRQRLGRELGSGSGWSDVSPSELESSTSGSDSSVSDGPPAPLHGPAQPMSPRVPPFSGQKGRSAREVRGVRGADAPAPFCHPAQLEQRRRKRLRSRRARNALRQTNTLCQSHASVPVSLGPPARSTLSQRGQSCRDTCPRCCPSGYNPSSVTLKPPVPGTRRGSSVAGEEPGAGCGVTFACAAGEGDGHHPAVVISQPDSGTSAASHCQSPLSTHHPRVTGDSSQDTAPGAEMGLLQQRREQPGGQAAAARRHRVRPRLTGPSRAWPSATAARCCACARD
ncbi:cytosolic carboxypeptidase 2 isoform X2 [Strix uralensis]|uniref:cytosolic carboxypeptidase 2 isoform X2 n=1 Tax=Strix uralensis TaxID=36305 RepID=UPI003DA6C439